MTLLSAAAWKRSAPPLDASVITDSAAEKPIQAEVLAVGSEKLLDNGDVRPLDFKVGDRVLFGK